jgi:glycosyltransferase involved in cell wall biosynthesis
MAKACTWADFHIVGGKEKDVGYWSNCLNKMDNIFLHGFIPPGEVDRYRISFDVLIAPYQYVVEVSTDKSNRNSNIGNWISPLKIFEYMAAKKPIVASRLPVLEEVLTHGYNALLCNPTDIAEWKSALQTIRDDACLRDSLAQQAYKDFKKNYSWQIRGEKVLDAFNGNYNKFNR